MPERILKSFESEWFTDIELLPESETCQSLNSLDNISIQWDDVVSEIWMGTRGFCDCLEREGDRQIFLDQ